MTFLDDSFTGETNRSEVAFWVLDRSRQGDFVQFLIDTEDEMTRPRANQIWTQAREYHVGDTGTVTDRPHRERIRRYWNSRLNDQFTFLGCVIGNDNVQSVLDSNPGAKYRPRLNTQSSDAIPAYAKAVQIGLEGIMFVAAINGTFVLFVPDESPS